MLSQKRVWYSQSIVGSFQDHFPARARRRRHSLLKAFTGHPAEIGETYFQHLRFTAAMALRLFLLSFAILIHGLLPFLFTCTASREIERIYGVMKSRNPEHKPGRTAWDER